MLVPEFLLPLPSGQIISYEEILSPFDIYSYGRKYESWILIPKEEQKGLQGIIIYANETGIRVLHRNNSFGGIVSKLKTTSTCPKSEFKKIGLVKITTDIIGNICEQLVLEIHYQ